MSQLAQQDATADRLILEGEAQPGHYLLPRQTKHPVKFDPGHEESNRVPGVVVPRKATQKLLGHASIQRTGHEYVDWDIDQLAETLREVVEE